MRKAIRLKVFQQMPNYKKPAAVVLKESFPLPPYSTIIGMVHSACKFTEYHPMKISIQGKHASDIAEIEKQYVFGSGLDESRIGGGFMLEGQKSGVCGGPKTIQFLSDVELCIHIVPEDESEIEYICDCLLNPDEYISIGRREDIARIDEVSIVELDEITDDNLDDEDNFNITGEYELFCPLDYLGSKISSTIYKIPKLFGYENKKRIWKEVIKSVCTSASEINQNEKLLLNDNVFLDRYNGNDNPESYIVVLA